MNNGVTRVRARETVGVDRSSGARPGWLSDDALLTVGQWQSERRRLTERWWSPNGKGQSDTIAHRSVAVQSSPLLVHVRGDICLALALWLRQRLVGRGLVGRTTHGSDGL